MTSTFGSDDLDVLRNRTFDEIGVGDRASIERTLTATDIQLFAAMSGDINPQHIDPQFAESTRFHGVIAHGMWGAALISAVLGTRLPGPGTLYAGQTLNFHEPVRVGDTLTVSVVVAERDPAKHQLVLDCLLHEAARQDRHLGPGDGDRPYFVEALARGVAKLARRSIRTR